MKIKQLKNGMKIFIDDSPKTKLVEMGFFILGGQYTESKKTKGYHHFLEHIVAMFPSKKYPDAQKNIQTLDKHGIFYQGITNEYNTQIILRGAHTSDNKIHDLMLDMLTNVIANFQLDENIFRQEKTSIQTELSNLLEEPHFKLEDILVNKIFTPNHIAAIDTPTELKFVSKVVPTDVIEFSKHAMIPERMVFYMVGNTPSYSVFKNYKKILEEIPNRQPSFSLSRIKKYTLPASTPKTGIFDIKEPTITTRLHFRWRLPVTHFDYKKRAIVHCVASTLQYIIIEELRTNLGLVYGVDVESYFDPFNDNLSYLSLTTEGITRAKANRITLSVVKIIDNLKTYFDDDMMKQYSIYATKEYEVYKNNCDIDRDLNYNIMHLLADKDTISKRQMLDYAKKITQNDVKKFIDKYITAQKLYFFYSGPDSIFR